MDTVLDRPVAVKLLRPGSGDEVVRARLRAEARLAGALAHPGVAQIYDYGEELSGDEPAPYIVMQYVEGTSLWHVLRDRRTLPADEVMDLVAQTASALEAAHVAGIVHRDLKPSNILVTDEGQAVLVDFGIARTLDAEPLTADGSVIGTADYISPEQTRGQIATPRSDVYSLGLVAYECLSGHKPFHRESQMATALAHLQDDAPALDEQVPPGVRALVTRMIARAPDGRPSASEVAQAARVATVASAPPTARRLVERRAGAPFAPAAGRRCGDWLPRSSPSRPSWQLVRRRRSSPISADRPRRGRRRARVARLDVERHLVDDPSASRGTVLDQDPASGAEVDGDSAVVIDVASGRTSFDAADVVGLSYDAAARALVELGLVPARRDVELPGGDGTVATARPAGRMPIGTTVTLTVGIEPAAPTTGATTAPTPARPTAHGQAPAAHGHEKPPKPAKPPKPKKPKKH